LPAELVLKDRPRGREKSRERTAVTVCIKLQLEPFAFGLHKLGIQHGSAPATSTTRLPIVPWKRRDMQPECDQSAEFRAVLAAAGVAMAHHEESQIAQHLIAAIPHGTCIECFADPERDPVWQRMWVNRPAIKDGMMAVSPGPGFGLALDAGMIKKYAVG
jgi:hypothetical protein